MKRARWGTLLVLRRWRRSFLQGIQYSANPISAHDAFLVYLCWPSHGFLRKLLLKAMPHIFGIALIMSLLFSAWEVFLLVQLTFQLHGDIEEQHDAWAFTLLALIRSLSVFLFYTRGALDIRHLLSEGKKA